MGELNIEELAARTGEPAERLREWQAIGLVGRDGRFDASDGERVRLVRFLLSRGFTLEAIARTDAEQDGFFDRALTLSFPRAGCRPTRWKSSPTGPGSTWTWCGGCGLHPG